ncbi:FtsX-like permease family protein (plasmid) [Bacillus thuringiensis]|uniref:FtsX-like permease family protein n=2 Tax=Bacillus TaxID=1386 RepID=A0A9W3VHI8_BACTU|nr:FtsX-like permease family protein [Bacillus thuringiensis]
MVMKKLIFLLFITTFIVISFLSIKQFEYIQFQSFNNDSTGEKWNLIVENGDSQKSKFENFRLLEKMAKQANVNFQRISYEKDKNNKDKTVYYVAFFENDKYFEGLKLKSGKFLNINSDQNDFMSTIKTHNNHQVGQLEIFHSFDPIEIRPMIAAEKTKDIKGTYTLNGKENAEKLKDLASEYGFIVKISKEEAQSSITQYPYQDMMYKASLILCLLIALAMLYDVINNYKEIAVRYLLGYNFWQIGAFLFRKYIIVFLSSLSIGISGLLVYLYFYNGFQQLFPFLYFWLNNTTPLILIILLIFIVTWLGTKTINISQMIKNKKPIKLLFYINIIIRFVLAIFLTLGLQQGISSFLGLKSTVDKEKKWSLLKDYSYLGVISESEPGLLKSQNEEEKRQFQLLYTELESQGAFYISPSAYYMDSSEIPIGPNPWGMDGKKVEINKNYLSVNPIIGVDNKRVEISDDPNSNEITVIVPKKFKKYENDIKSTIAKDYTGIYNETDSIPPKVNILYVKNNQSYFTFSTNMAEKNNYEITDPIAIIVNSKFDPRILATSISMGYGYYTKNSDRENPFKVTQDTLKKHNFDKVWQPISVAYSNVELKIANNKELLQLATIYCSLFVILAAVLLFFSSMYYLEMNKKSLALQWIFGYNFFEKHYLAYLVILVFWNFTFAICFFNTSNTLLLVKTIIGLTIFDIILISIILSIKEYNITKQILIEK